MNQLNLARVSECSAATGEGAALQNLEADAGDGTGAYNALFPAEAGIHFTTMGYSHLNN